MELRRGTSACRETGASPLAESEWDLTELSGSLAVKNVYFAALRGVG